MLCNGCVAIKIVLKYGKKGGGNMDSVNRYGVKVEHDTAVAGNSRIGMHEHDFYELYFLVSGNRRYLMGHTVYDVAPGDMVFVPKKQLHRTTSADKTGYDRYVLYFSDRQAGALSASLGEEAFSELMNSGCMVLPKHVSEEIQRDLERISRDIGNPDAMTDIFVTHLLRGIILNAARYGVQRQSLAGESADKVQMVAKYITENYPQEITLAEAAQMACLEKTYFSKRFKQLTGFGFQEYLLQTRILAAERLLAESQFSVGQIAEKCGFSSGNYFGDVFQRYKGLSPSEYRKRYQKQPLFIPVKD